MNLQQSDLRTELHKVKKQQRTKVLRFYGLLTAQMRMVPDFIIIGTQRSGTTSLYNYLTNHPRILPALMKEVHFFDLAFSKGLNWYRANFPMVSTKEGEQKMFTGEASPYYIIHPHAPTRIASLFPSIKLIVLLRNPVDRAYSHYQHEVKLGFERLSFEDAIKQEPSRLQGEMEKMVGDENYMSFNHRHFSYLARGIYVDQLKNWTKLFPQEQMLIIKSEDFFEWPQKVLSQVFGFLNLPDWSFPGFKVHNRLQYHEMKAETRDRLSEYFDPFNQSLNNFLRMDFGWS